MLFIVSDLKRLVTFEDSFGSLHHQEHLLGLLPYLQSSSCLYNISCPSSDLSSVSGCTYFGGEVGVCLCATGAGGGGFTVYCLQIELLCLYFNFPYFPCVSRRCLWGIKQTLALDLICTVNLLLIGTNHTKV